MPNLYLPGASILLSLFLVILFFSKKRQKNSDTKIFQFMIIIQLLESAVETIIYYIAYTSNNVFMLIFLNISKTNNNVSKTNNFDYLTSNSTICLKI